MSRLERFLLIGIVFLIGVKVMTAKQEDFQSDPPRGEVYAPDAMAPPAPSPYAKGDYDWDPAGFSRDGIPKKLSLESGGRIPDRHGMTDTQLAFVYAYIIEYHYARALRRAKASCGANTQTEISNWEVRHAATLENTRKVLGAIDHEAPSKGSVPEAMQRLLCAQVARRLVAGGYEPHPEAVARLADAGARIRG